MRAIEELAAVDPGRDHRAGRLRRAGDPVAATTRHAWDFLAVLADGVVQRVYRKNRLPNYAVFDEQRYFVPGAEGRRGRESPASGVGLTICEDTWAPGAAPARPRPTRARS